MLQWKFLGSISIDRDLISFLGPAPSGEASKASRPLQGAQMKEGPALLPSVLVPAGRPDQEMLLRSRPRRRCNG